jgi:hypothetical protein
MSRSSRHDRWCHYYVGLSCVDLGLAVTAILYRAAVAGLAVVIQVSDLRVILISSDSLLERSGLHSGTHSNHLGERHGPARLD